MATNVELGYSEKIRERLRLLADLAEEGDARARTFPALLREAADLLTTDEDLDLVKETDNLRAARRRAQILFDRLLDKYIAGDPNAPVLPPALIADLRVWVTEFGRAED